MIVEMGQQQEVAAGIEVHYLTGRLRISICWHKSQRRPPLELTVPTVNDVSSPTVDSRVLPHMEASVNPLGGQHCSIRVRHVIVASGGGDDEPVVPNISVQVVRGGLPVYLAVCQGAGADGGALSITETPSLPLVVAAQEAREEDEPVEGSTKIGGTLAVEVLGDNRLVVVQKRWPRRGPLRLSMLIPQRLWVGTEHPFLTSDFAVRLGDFAIAVNYPAGMQLYRSDGVDVQRMLWVKVSRPWRRPEELHLFRGLCGSGELILEPRAVPDSAIRRPIED